MMRWRNLTWKHLFILLLLLHLVPLWVFTYFPSQDGPSHIYNASILKEYHKHENYKLRDVFKLNITIFPNWTSHLTMALLLYIFPPIIAEKILLTLAVGLAPISFFYFLDAVHKRGFLFGWLGFLFSYNYLLFMGFYNFALSISFFFFSFGYWWKHRENLCVNHVIVLYILLLVTYLCHIASYGLALLAMSVAALCLWGHEAIAAAWRKQEGAEGELLNAKNVRNRAYEMLGGFLSGLKPLIRFAGYMLPAYFVLTEYYLQSLKANDSGYHKGMDFISDYFWGVKSIVYFSDWHIPVHHVLLGILGVAIIVSLIYRIERRQWLRTSDVFLLIAVLFTIMFIKAPWAVGPGGGAWINDRIHPYILLMLAPWLAPDMGKIFRFSFTGALVAICLVHLGRSTYDHARLNREIAELTSGVHLMAPHTAYSIRSHDWRKSEALGRVEYVKPFGHAMAFYGLANKDIVHLSNYEANYDYFPINHNNRNVVSDYVVAWAYPAEEKFADLTPNYNLIHQTRNLKLFRIKGAEGPDLSVWSGTLDGQLIIHFDMQPNGGVTAEGGKNHKPEPNEAGAFWRAP